MDKLAQTTLVLGLGNLLLGDEGFGVHVIRKLQMVELPSCVKVVEGGVGGYNLLGYLQGVSRLLIVDAMMTGSQPGELLLFQPGPSFKDREQNGLSFHQTGILELVRLSQLLDNDPEVWFLVACPEELEPSMVLSPRLERTVGQAVELISKLCHNDFSGLERSAELCIQPSLS
jgi:hydrogenase maturation protease